MSRKTFLLVSAIFFSATTVLHAWRIVAGWEAFIGNTALPFWLSWVAMVVGGYLAIQAWKLSKKD